MAKTRINASELARRTGMPASTIKKIRNRSNPNPTLTTLIGLARYFSITVSQLVGDETLPPAKLEEIGRENAKTKRYLPLLSWKEVITWPHNNHRSFTTIENKYSENAYALRVDEDDWGALTKGTILIIDPTATIEHRDFVVVYKEGQEAPSLKQILYDEGQMYLKPIVPGYHMTLFTPQHRSLGVMMEYQKHIKNKILPVQ